MRHLEKDILKNWDKLTPKQQAVALSRFCRKTFQETYHDILCRTAIDLIAPDM